MAHLRLRTWFLSAVLGVGTQSIVGCLYDPDNPCGEGMVEEGEGDTVRCACPEGSVSTEDGCVTCGEHEVATATGCVCEKGYTRPSAGEPCAEAPPPGGLGSECDPEDPACTEPYDHCEPASGSGYCTSGCETNDDCEGGYVCNADSICQRPPLGMGMSCSGPEDCAGTEATYCDTIVSMTCLVEGCQVDPNDCFEGNECCDLTAVGVPQQICVPVGACPT